MSTIIIYELDGTTLYVVGRWENGSWVFDKKDFASVNHIEDYDEEMILDRYNGPVLFGVREENAPLLISEIPLPMRPNGVKKQEEGTSDWVEKKIDLANRLEDGELDESKYSDEDIEKIKSWKWYDG